MVLTRRSNLTGKVSSMDIPSLSEKELSKWESTPKSERPLIQVAFPNLNNDEREFILTGITPDEWDKAFPKEDK